jgi:hypothetical protein
MDDALTAVDSDGWIYDVATGEVVGLATAADDFRIDSPEAAEWALEVRSRIEGEIAGIDARIAAVTEQLQRLRKAKMRRLSWWEWKFGDQLVGFARTQLNGKSRTWRCTWGSVAFRSVKGSRKIVDMAAAVGFVRSFAPEEVRVAESVTLAGVDKAVAAAEAATGEREELEFLVTMPGGENVAIETGIYLREDVK